MKLKENALELARNLEMDKYEQRHEQYWHHLMEYEDSDWEALEYLCKKYQPNGKFYLSKKWHDKERTWQYQWEPGMFLYELRLHLLHRKQFKTRVVIESEIETLFHSHYKCREIMEKVFSPVLGLNAAKKQLRQCQDVVTQQTQRVQKITQGLKSNDDIELFISLGSD